MSLTERQLACLRHAADGHTQEAIARRLHVTARTIKRDMHDALQQLGARDITHAVGIAYRSGLLEVQPVADELVAVVRLAERMGYWIALVPRSAA